MTLVVRPVELVLQMTLSDLVRDGYHAEQGWATNFGLPGREASIQEESLLIETSLPFSIETAAQLSLALLIATDVIFRICEILFSVKSH